MRYQLIFMLFLVFMVPQTVDAQCSMCRAVLESQTDTSAAEGINNGIVYLMIFPYILIGGIGYFIYKTLRKGRTSPEG